MVQEFVKKEEKPQNEKIKILTPIIMKTTAQGEVDIFLNHEIEPPQDLNELGLKLSIIPSDTTIQKMEGQNITEALGFDWRYVSYVPDQGMLSLSMTFHYPQKISCQLVFDTLQIDFMD